MALELPENVVVSKLDELASWCRKNSLWPMPFATACCGIELMATGASRHDMARFGAEVFSLQSPTMRFDDCGRTRGDEDVAGTAADLATDARTQMVHFDGRLRLDGRRLRHV